MSKLCDSQWIVLTIFTMTLLTLLVPRAQAQAPVFEIVPVHSSIKFHVKSSTTIAGKFDKWDASLSSFLAIRGWNGETWGANQRISVAEVLAVNTINGAYNSHEEAAKGPISLGKHADFVMLPDEIFTVDESKIKDIQIVRTVVGGKTVYQA